MGNVVTTTRVGDTATVDVNGKKYKHKGKSCNVTIVNGTVYFNGLLAEPVVPWWKKVLKKN